MWVDTYNKNVKLLNGSSVKRLHDEMQRLEKEYPEMFATINVLALALAEKIEKLGQVETDDGISMISLIPKHVVNFALQTQLVLPTKDELCDKLNKWATHVWYEKLRQGKLEEPDHYCG